MLAPAFTEDVQRHFVDTYVLDNRDPHFAVITCAYEKLPKENPILKMLVDLHVLFHIEPTLRDESGDQNIVDTVNENALPRKFLLRIMHKYVQKKQVAKRDRLNAANYR